MLNRRTLRIKIMQMLFAYEQCKEANYVLGLDSIEETFKPDLNSMKVQNKEMLKGQREVATSLFEKKFNGETVLESSDPRVQTSIDDALSLVAKLTKKDYTYFRKHIVIEVEKINGLYISVLNLIPALESVAAQDKRVSAAAFSCNPFVPALREHPGLRKETLRNGGNWDQQMDVVRGWWRDCVKTDKTVQDYLALAKPEAADHLQFIKHLVRKLILGKTPINAWYEDHDLWWAEDHEIVRSMTDKTLKSMDDDGSIEIQKLSLNWEEDKEFIERLFTSAAQLDTEYHELIASHTKNWEVERLPLTDRVILHMALAEMLAFPNIPVKVTINEYIELAKEYSTPKSRQFINGILDVLSKEMVRSGKIRKSGRGLIDNK
jgi:N utilization substance protein B